MKIEMDEATQTAFDAASAECRGWAREQALFLAGVKHGCWDEQRRWKATKTYADSVMANYERVYEKHARLLTALRMDEPWPFFSVLSKLAEAAEILLREMNYDGHGWEQIDHAAVHAREIVAAVKVKGDDGD